MQKEKEFFFIHKKKLFKFVNTRALKDFWPLSDFTQFYQAIREILKYKGCFILLKSYIRR